MPKVSSLFPAVQDVYKRQTMESGNISAVRETPDSNGQYGVGVTDGGAVSYTHLDVYKRQHLTYSFAQRAAYSAYRSLTARLHFLCTAHGAAVEDVYKRQSFIRLSNCSRVMFKALQRSSVSSCVTSRGTNVIS